MSRNPSMSLKLQLWRGTNKPNSYNTDRKLYEIYSGESVGYTTYTSCRETLSKGLRNSIRTIGGSLPDAVVQHLHINSELTINVQKRMVLEDVVAVLNSGANCLLGYPLITKFDLTEGGSSQFTLSPKFLSSGCPEGPLSFVMFFLNRLEDFPAHVMASSNAVQDILKSKGAQLNGGSSFGSTTAGYMYALYSYDNKISIPWLLSEGGATTGVGHYISSFIFPLQLRQVADFATKYKIDPEYFGDSGVASFIRLLQSNSKSW